MHTWLMGSQGISKEAVKNDFGWGTKNFHQMGRDKIRLIRDFTRSGVNVLVSDIDVVWLRNPLPFFAVPSGGCFSVFGSVEVGDDD